MRARLLAPVLVALAACAAAVDPVAVDPYRDPESACRALADALLAHADRCGFASPLAESWFDDAAARCEGMNRPTVSRDFSRVRRCVAALEAAACWQEELDGECDRAIFGTVPDGGACVSDVDCAPELWGCSPAGGTCGGTCRAFGGEGASCGAADAPCAAGLRCDGSTCQPLVPQNGSCTVDGDCQPGLACTGALPKTCQPVLGTLCGDAGGCATSDDGAYYCPVWEPLASRACRRLGSVSTDASRCGGGKVCEADAWCDGTECKLRVLDGPCDSDDACLAPATCQQVGSAGRCHVPARIGEGCVVGLHDCEAGAYCAGPDLASAGTCRSWPGPGGTCGLLDEVVGCIDGWCKPPDGGDGSSTCSPYTHVGDACVSSQECGGDIGAARCVDLVCATSCPQ